MRLLGHIRSRSRLKNASNGDNNPNDNRYQPPAADLFRVQPKPHPCSRFSTSLLHELFSRVCPHSRDDSYISCEESMIDGGCMLCDMKDLSQCALVNKQWSEAAQTLLYHNVRIDTVHYCDREADHSAQRQKRSLIGRNAPLKNLPQERLHLFSRSVRENRFLACQVQYLKTPYLTREVSKADLARTVSVLPNLRYVDLPDDFYNDDPSSNTLRQELQTQCRDIRQMKYASGAEVSFQRLAQARHWPNLETLELLHLSMESTVILDIFTSFKTLRHVKLTNLHFLDDSIFGSQPTNTSPFPPLAVLEIRSIPNVSARGLLTYLSYREVKEALRSLTLADTGGILPSDHSQILAAAPSLTTFHVVESVSRAMRLSQTPLLASCSLNVLHYEICSTDSSLRGLSVLSDSYYSYLASSILTGNLPSLSQVYALSPSLATMLLRDPRSGFTVDGIDDSYPSLYHVVSRPLRVYTKAVTELEWNLTLLNPATLTDRHGSATITRPMSLYVENQLSPQRRPKGGEGVMMGNGFGGFLAVPSTAPGLENSKLNKGRKDVDAWMG